MLWQVETLATDAFGFLTFTVSNESDMEFCVRIKECVSVTI